MKDITVVRSEGGRDAAETAGDDRRAGGENLAAHYKQLGIGSVAAAAAFLGGQGRKGKRTAR